MRFFNHLRQDCYHNILCLYLWLYISNFFSKLFTSKYQLIPIYFIFKRAAKNIVNKYETWPQHCPAGGVYNITRVRIQLNVIAWNHIYYLVTLRPDVQMFLLQFWRVTVVSYLLRSQSSSTVRLNSNENFIIVAIYFYLFSGLFKKKKITNGQKQK